jgi:protein-tyrosine phosphatase
MKILMVCLGNICRSPLAEGIMRHKIQQRQLDGWVVDSAGTGNWHSGELPDSRSIATARKYAIDITDQRARQFRVEDFDRFDLILAMDKSNYRDLLSLASNDEHHSKVDMILAVAYPGSHDQVPDPYLDDNGFEPVFHLLNDACERVIDQILSDKK